MLNPSTKQIHIKVEYFIISEENNHTLNQDTNNDASNHPNRTCHNSQENNKIKINDNTY